MFVLKDVRVGQNGTLMSWIKRDIVFYVPFYPFIIYWLFIFFLDHLFLPSVTTHHPTSDLQQEAPGVGHQTDLNKYQDRSSPSSMDIVYDGWPIPIGIDQSTNPSGYNLR